MKLPATAADLRRLQRALRRSANRAQLTRAVRGRAEALARGDALAVARHEATLLRVEAALVALDRLDAAEAPADGGDTPQP